MRKFDTKATVFDEKTPEEDRRRHRLKCCVYKNKNEKNRLNTLNNLKNKHTHICVCVLDRKNENNWR